MNILIAGCGYLGRALGSALAARGDRVWGLCRSEASCQKIRALSVPGFEPVQADLTRLNGPGGSAGGPGDLVEGQGNFARRFPRLDAAVACQAPARGESYRNAYVEGTRGLIRALGPDFLCRFIFVSSSSVYGPRGGGWVEADTAIDPALLDEDARALREAEGLALAGPGLGMVLRLSGIYGPERNRLDAIRSGRFVPPTGGVWTNRVHRDDAVSALVCLLEKGARGQVYLASDDLPATQAEFYGWLLRELNIKQARIFPEPARSAEDSKRCSNSKLKTLGWTPRYPSYKEGYGELL